jgi:hypothetical protein
MKSFIRIVMVLCAITAHFALSGCGSGGSGGSQNAVITTSNAITSPESAGNSYSLIDDYGFEPATRMSTESNNTGGIILRASIEDKISPTNPADIFRIDIQSPIIANSTYSIGDNIGNPEFPGEIQFFNGNPTTLLHTKSGTITFTSYGQNTGDLIAGSFDVQVENQDPYATKTTYSIKGSFCFVVNSPGPIVPPNNFL